MTALQLLKITIDQLRIGMHVSNVFSGNGTLLYSSNTLIQKQEQIEALKRQGVRSLTINLHKGSTGEVPVEKTVEKPVEVSAALPQGIRTGIYSDEIVSKALAMREEATESIQRVMFSAKTGRMFSIKSIVSSVEEITESMVVDPELMMSLCRLKSHTVEAYNHSVNVAVLMIGFASSLGFSKEKIAAAGVAGMLHDIGLVTLPEGLFMRQSSSTRQEMELYKMHPRNGFDILSQQPNRYPDGVLNVVSQHHERINGGGYPSLLADDQISDLSLICAISDMYDTLTTRGMYSKIFLPQEALAHIFQGADEEFPRSYVEQFTKLLGIYPVGSFVKLDTGEMGVVVKNNRKKLLAPTVRVLFNSLGVRLITPYIKDLAVADTQSEDQLARILYSLDPSSHKIEVEQFIIQRAS